MSGVVFVLMLLVCFAITPLCLFMYDVVCLCCCLLPFSILSLRLCASTIVVVIILIILLSAAAAGVAV